MSNYGLSDEDLWDCQQLFESFDRDQSKSIDASELANLLRVKGLKPSDNEVQDILKKFDKDNSGKIEFEEFIEAYKEMKKCPLNNEDVVKAFNFFDADKSGFLDINEFKYFLCKRGEKLSEEEVEKFFKNFDKNKDGKISLDEFKKILDF